MLADISAGSETPGMVSKVLKWRSENKVEAEKLWGDIDMANKEILGLFEKLVEISKADQEAYERELTRASDKPIEGLDATTPTSSALRQLFSTTQYLRSLLRQMSSLSAVPIEPPQQTSLIDATFGCPGVVMAAVPGAGGMDAIYAIAIGDTAAENVEKMWEKRDGNVGRLLSKEGKGGARKEKLDEVKGLTNALKRI